MCWGVEQVKKWVRFCLQYIVRGTKRPRKNSKPEMTNIVRTMGKMLDKINYKLF